MIILRLPSLTSLEKASLEKASLEKAKLEKAIPEKSSESEHAVVRLHPDKMKRLDKIFLLEAPDYDDQKIKRAELIIPTLPLPICPEIDAWVLDELPISMVNADFYNDMILNRSFAGVQPDVETYLRQYDHKHPEWGSSTIAMLGDRSVRKKSGVEVLLNCTDGDCVVFKPVGLGILPFFIRGIPMKATVLLVKSVFPLAIDQEENPLVLLSHDAFDRAGMGYLLKKNSMIPKGTAFLDFHEPRQYTGKHILKLNVCAWVFPKTRQHPNIPDRFGFGVYFGRNSAQNYFEKYEPDESLELEDNTKVAELLAVVKALKQVLRFRHVMGLWFRQVHASVTSGSAYVFEGLINYISHTNPSEVTFRTSGPRRGLWVEIYSLCDSIRAMCADNSDGSGVKLVFTHIQKLNDKREASALAQKAALGQTRDGMLLINEEEGEGRKEMLRSFNQFEMAEQKWEIIDAGVCSPVGLPDGVDVVGLHCCCAKKE